MFLNRQMKSGRHQEASLRKQSKGGKRYKQSGTGRKVAGAVLISIILLATILAADYLLQEGKIYRGVSVAGIPVGGKTPEEAKQIIESHTTGTLKSIEFSGAGERATLSSAELGIYFNVDSTVQRAYDVGRRGGIQERLSDRVNSTIGAAQVAPDVEYNTGVAKAAIESLAGKLNREPKDASVSVVNGKVKVQGAHSGYKLNQAATFENLQRSVDNLNGKVAIVGDTSKPAIPTPAAEEAGKKIQQALAQPLVLNSPGQQWVLQPAQVGQIIKASPNGSQIQVGIDEGRLKTAAADMYGALNVDPVEAGFVPFGNSVKVTPSRAGMRIEEDKFLQALNQGLFSGRYQYDVPVQVSQPKLSTEKAEELKPTALLGEYKTDYTWDQDPGRRVNLQIASDAINDTLLAPGQVFSFNAIAAPLKYEGAKVIVNGKVDYADGGGLCQISSTLYMAANYAGLDIVERTPHYAELPYIRPGFDATVWFGSIDMKFKNTSGSYILIREWMSDGFVYARIYGKPTGKQVTMDSQKVYDGKDSKGKPLTKWVTYKKVTQNGQVVFNDVLHEDTYKYLEPYTTPDKDRPPN